MPRPISALRRLLTHEAAGGMMLIAAAAAAMLIANSPLAPLYALVLDTYALGLSMLHWINDGLMALFFLLVGLEIKRELLDGQLASWPHRVLPGIAAVGGMVVPALFYLVFNFASPQALRGWAIPTATDIAFSLAVLAILGKRAPISLKVFLTALAILDDLGAIVIIAVFYSHDLSPLMLALAVVSLAVLIGLNRAGVAWLSPYLAIGALLWFFVLKSGVHATVAGVLVALTIPLRLSRGRPDDAHSPLHRLENALQPWVSYLVLPLFGLANAGVALTGATVALSQPVTLGTALGLFLGKQVGVFGSIWMAVRAGIARRPAGTDWAHLYGLSLLCGIGFTMSLFIGLLAFGDSAGLQNEAKAGVLTGSLLSAVAGWLVLRFCPKHQASPGR